MKEWKGHTEGRGRMLVSKGKENLDRGGLHLDLRLRENKQTGSETRMDGEKKM